MKNKITVIISTIMSYNWFYCPREPREEKQEVSVRARNFNYKCVRQVLFGDIFGAVMNSCCPEPGVRYDVAFNNSQARKDDAACFYN